MRRLETDARGDVFVATGVRGFDRQMAGFRPGGQDRRGSAWSLTNVRPFSCTADASGWYLPGHLKDRDLDGIPGLPDAVAAAAADADPDTHLLVYEFRHREGIGTIVHGHVVTRGSRGHHELVGAFPAPGRAAAAVIGEMVPFVSNPPGTAARVREVLAPARLADMLSFLSRVPPSAAAVIRDVSGELAREFPPGCERRAAAIWKELVAGPGGYCLSLTAEGAAVKARCDALLSSDGPVTEKMARTAMAHLEHMATSRRKHGTSDPPSAIASFAAAASGPATGPDAAPRQEEAPYPSARTLA